MPNLSDRARWALDSALSRAGAAVDQGVLQFMRRAMNATAGRRDAVHRADRHGPRSVRASHGFSSPAAVAGDPRARLQEIAEHYRGAEGALFEPPPEPVVVEAERPARAGAARVLDLSYPSRHLPTWPAYRDEFASYAANLTARARLYCGAASPRPTVVCLHGWGGGRVWLEERAFVVPYLLRIGLDVALFQLPFHGQRTPAGAPRSGALFPGPNVVRTNETFGQAIGDLRGLALYLRRRGAPAVGAVGMSLGGYTAALWAGLDRLDFAAALIPAVSMARLFWSHGEGSPARRRAERAGVTADLLDEAFAVHAPLRRPVLLSRDRLLIAAARGDRITPPEQAEMLWRHWGEPELCWVAGGHLTQLARGDAFRAIRRLVTNLGLVSQDPWSGSNGAPPVGSRPKGAS